MKTRADFSENPAENRLGGKSGEIGPNSESVAALNLSALATSKAWSRVNAAREIVAAGVSGEW